MAVRPEHDAFIPLSRHDLLELVVTDAGPARDAPLSAEDKLRLIDLGRRLARRFHADSFAVREQLKEAYAPFDPDSELKALRSPGDDRREALARQLFDRLEKLLLRANYRRLTHDQLLEAQLIAGDLGIDLSIDLTAFRHIDVFVRGELFARRVRRPIRSLFRAETFTVEIYPRVVLIFQQQPHPRLPKDADFRNVYLKLFRDIPKMDLEMLIPGAKLRMSTTERGKLGASVASGVGTFLWPFVKPLLGIAKFAAMTTFGWLALAGGLFGVAYRQYSGYQFTVRSYHLRLAQRLYFQNLDNNAGVIFRLIDAAVEQEWREAMLGYYYLWHFAGADGWTAERLDDYVELDLERRAGVAVDFDIHDALAKLTRLGFVTRNGPRYVAVPIDEALARLPAEPEAG